MRALVLLSVLVFAGSVICQRGTTSSYAPGCNGAVLNASFQPQMGGGGGAELLVLQASGLHPHTTSTPSFGVMAWGFNPTNIPVIGSCVIHVDAIWAIGFVPDAQGNHLWQRSWPRSIGGEMRIQMGTLRADPLEVRVTNAILAVSNN